MFKFLHYLLNLRHYREKVIAIIKCTFIYLFISIVLYFCFNSDRNEVNRAISDIKSFMAPNLAFSDDSQANNLEPCTVVRVIDGDTLVAKVQGKEEKIRLIGVNCPEDTTKKEAYGKEATEYTKKLLPPRKTIYLEKDVSERDKYGRLLMYVWLADKPDANKLPEQMLNARLVRDGYAQVHTVPPDIKYQSDFLKLQREARENKRGLWK